MTVPIKFITLCQPLPSELLRKSVNFVLSLCFVTDGLSCRGDQSLFAIYRFIRRKNKFEFTTYRWGFLSFCSHDNCRETVLLVLCNFFALHDIRIDVVVCVFEVFTNAVSKFSHLDWCSSIWTPLMTFFCTFCCGKNFTCCRDWNSK